MSKTVMLGWASTRFEVTNEGYEEIKKLIKIFQICPNCHYQTNQDDHLLVGKKCLSCVLSAYPSITFIGQSGENSEGNKIYSFLNKAGITLTSTENDTDKPEEDLALSIEKAGFVVPARYKPFKSTEEVRLGRSNWRRVRKVFAIRYRAAL